jgi:hypothetical protein
LAKKCFCSANTVALKWVHATRKGFYKFVMFFALIVNWNLSVGLYPVSINKERTKIISDGSPITQVASLFGVPSQFAGSNVPEQFPINSAKLQSYFLFETLLYASSFSALFNYIPPFLSLFSFSIPVIYLEPGQLSRCSSRCSQCTTGRTTEEHWFHSRQTHENFSLPKVQPLLEMQPPIRWIPWAPPPGGEETKV